MRGLIRRPSGAMQQQTGGFQPMFSMLDDLRREFDRFFQEAETFLPIPAAAIGAPTWPAFVPPVDIAETKTEYVVTAEVPGIDPNNIDVRLEGNTLILRGEREQIKDEDIGMVHRSERSFGSFSRSFTLPDDVEADKIAARFRNGVLTITVPKSAKAQPKQVQIQAEEGAGMTRQISASGPSTASMSQPGQAQPAQAGQGTQGQQQPGQQQP